MLLPHTLARHTPESELSDDEVRARLREEDPEFYDLIPEDMVAPFDPLRIWHWRTEHTKTLADNVVVVKGRSGTYIRGAVISIDYDLAMLEAVMDAFLVALFRNPSSG